MRTTTSLCWWRHVDIPGLPRGCRMLSLAPCHGHWVCRLPVQPDMEWAQADSHHLSAPWVWCSVCGAHSKARNHNLRYPCGGELRRGRWKLKQSASGQDPNGTQPAGTYQVRRWRTADLEERELQLC